MAPRRDRSGLFSFPEPHWQAVEADRVWKAPGHRTPVPGPSHTRWKSGPPVHRPAGIPTSYAQPRRRGLKREDYKPGGGNKKASKSVGLFFSLQWSRRTLGAPFHLPPKALREVLSPEHMPALSQ